MDETKENPYVKTVSKRLRNVRKKLLKIEGLETKTESLNAEQEVLVQSKPTLKVLNDELQQILLTFETLEVSAEAGNVLEQPKSSDSNTSKPQMNGDEGDDLKVSETDSNDTFSSQGQQQIKPEAAEESRVAGETNLTASDSTPSVEGEAAGANGEDKVSDAALSRLLESVAVLVKTLNMLSNPMLYQQLLYVFPDHILRDIVRLAHLCLEMPTFDNTGNVIMKQELPGVEHLRRYAEYSEERVKIITVGDNSMYLSCSYGDLAKGVKHIFDYIAQVEDSWAGAGIGSSDLLQVNAVFAQRAQGMADQAPPHGIDMAQPYPATAMPSSPYMAGPAPANFAMQRVGMMPEVAYDPTMQPMAEAMQGQQAVYAATAASGWDFTMPMYAAGQDRKGNRGMRNFPGGNHGQGESGGRVRDHQARHKGKKQTRYDNGNGQRGGEGEGEGRNQRDNRGDGGRRDRGQKGSKGNWMGQNHAGPQQVGKQGNAEGGQQEAEEATA
ncbi:hypothetical protein GUITHDRAFT_148553 [Guillardia theta CCMP2712]|uniref:Uncharacterized protein n=2 Tax=Guillardia theta TaxID=55529 RepID=L1I9E5_GUITC|nr:hypothetical protein GUITHDRAFT_148553 [Guillardia theta CCMP2712]EKX32529.1 hypothetical protein GUITHDRAFT_148553 [Guillardia theta CCMP2712]|eukprot:XP_005819509.1 hypothetical protein GUITHDRAFT_148553 [Guillardia theta CCMP2712]